MPLDLTQLGSSEHFLGETKIFLNLKMVIKSGATIIKLKDRSLSFDDISSSLFLFQKSLR
jgi:hypothetical protein